MKLLEKHHYESHKTDRKYYVDCKNENIPIEPKEIVKYTSYPDVSIIRAVTKDDTIKKRHIVVKISSFPVALPSEFDIGSQLYKLPGFIKYICEFQCYDDTNNKMRKTRPNTFPVSINTTLCMADKTVAANHKQVLIMPYIQEGSMEGYNWTPENLDLLTTVIKHVVLSLANAYIKVGFIHNDLHWGNILLKKTKTTEILYDCISIGIPTNGYKVVIMDFEKAQLKSTQHDLFWSNLKLFLRFDRMSVDNQFISWNNDKIITFVQRMMSMRISPVNTIGELVLLIDKSTFNVIRSTQIKYDPDQW